MYIRHQKKQHLALLDLRTKTHVLPEPIIEDRVGLPYHEVNFMTGKEIRDRTERCVSTRIICVIQDHNNRYIPTKDLDRQVLENN